jgi:hypothetical protein
MSYTEDEFRESVNRWTALAPEQRPAWNYQSWSPTDSRKLVKYLSSQLTKHKGSYVRVYPGLDEEGNAILWHTVEKDGTIFGPFNASHPCPPFCG